MKKIAARCALLSLLVLASACAQLPGEMTTSEGVTNLQSPAPDPIASIAAQPAPVSTPVAAVATNIPETRIKTQPKDVWERVRNGYTMKPMDTDLVRHWESFYSAKPEYFARMVDRSRHYLFHIIEEIERRKMPAEIALLPMIESAYNPQAYSKAHASGLWQFIPSTGKNYGLRQNWWYDGRRDVIAATNAALDYLEKLHSMFNDWELALASYNWGEGAVSRAIARNQARGLPTDYASLTMPAETRNYLPKLIAVKNIIADPARFGVKLASVPNEPYFEVISVKRHIDIKLAAKFAGMPLDEFRFLNPAHNKPVIKSDGSETIVLPRNRVSAFMTNLENHDKPMVSWQAHTVKAGEKPEKIAASYGMSVTELKQVNNISASNKFRAGLPLLVPVKDGATPNLPDLPATPVSMSKAYQAARTTHVKGAKPVKHATQAKAVKRSPAKRAQTPVKAGKAKPPAKPAVVASQHQR
jgi:membrane-bound lytic murein transglycosylase D